MLRNAYLKHTPEDFPVAYADQSRILSIPIYPEMSEEMVSYVAQVIERFFQRSGNSFVAVAQSTEPLGS